MGKKTEAIEKVLWETGGAVSLANWQDYRRLGKVLTEKAELLRRAAEEGEFEKMVSGLEANREDAEYAELIDNLHKAQTEGTGRKPLRLKIEATVTLV